MFYRTSITNIKRSTNLKKMKQIDKVKHLDLNIEYNEKNVQADVNISFAPSVIVYDNNILLII